MNNQGQLVFARVFYGVEGWKQQIMLYENGRLRRMTTNTVEDASPSVNDDGTIVFQRFNGAWEAWNIVRLQDGVQQTLSTVFVSSSWPSVGNTGLIMWQGSPDDASSELFEYRNGVAAQVTANGLTNLRPRVNSNEDFAWIQSESWKSPWFSKIMCSIDGTVHELTDGTTTTSGLGFNDAGSVIWADSQGLKLWDGGVHVVDPTPGLIAGAVNSAGALVYFERQGSDSVAYLLLDGVKYEFVGPNPNGSYDFESYDINDSGEVAFTYGFVPAYDVMLMWRIRDAGDFTGDGRVDVRDLVSMFNCLSNPEHGLEMPPVCLRIFDYDEDQDIDLHDFGAFQRLVTVDP